MTSAIAKDQNVERQIQKQIGCMAGFFSIFDRHHILAGKRLQSTKRLPPPPAPTATSPPPVVNTSSEPEKPTISSAASPKPVDLTPKSPLPLLESRPAWRSAKEVPRLSLDSRATTDSKGSLHPKEIRTDALLDTCRRSVCTENGDDAHHHRSPSVVARLMGLEPLPDSANSSLQLGRKAPELQRSASESESSISRDIFSSRFNINAKNFNLKHPTRSNPTASNNSFEHESKSLNLRNYSSKQGTSTNNAKMPKGSNANAFQRKGFYDSGDIFPEPKQIDQIYGGIEKRLRIKGFNETSNDLESLKQILEALQLKGLLHTNRPSNKSHRNLVYDESSSPIVVMRSSRSPTSSPIKQRNRNAVSENSPMVSPRRDRSVTDRTVKSPSRSSRSMSLPARTSPSGTRPNSLIKPRPLSVETQRRANENRRVSPVNSPKMSSSRAGPDSTVRNRNKKSMAGTRQKEKITTVVFADDESSSISESSFSTSIETEKWKMEEHKGGRNFLERADKLLHSIAEINATDLSPVSVLDPSLYKDDSASPSPIAMKRSIDFKDLSDDSEDEMWSEMISPIYSKHEEVSNDCDFIYISDVLRAMDCLPQDCDVFLLLEKQQYIKGKDKSKASRLQRKLIFDTVYEIIEWNRKLSTWKATTEPSLQDIWTEFQRIRERDVAEDMLEAICGMLRKDLARDAINGWRDRQVEMSESVLDIERLIFKDLVCETIQDVTRLASTKIMSMMMPRRKLIY